MSDPPEQETDRKRRLLWLSVNSSYSHASLALPLIHAACAGTRGWEWIPLETTVAEDRAGIAASLAAMRGDLHPPLDALARAVVRNLCIDYLRRRRATFVGRCPEQADVPATDDGEDPCARVMRLIDKLPAAQQVVMRLRHIDGMETADIARLTGATEAAVRKQLSRARMAVRKHYLDDLRHE